MLNVLPGTEVRARGLRWEVIQTDQLGTQTMYRLRALEGPLQGRELDLLAPFEPIEPIAHDLRLDRAAPLRNWLVYHQSFLLEQALGPNALLAVQPGRLRVEPYQLVPVLRAIRMSRVRLLLADGVGLGKTIQAGLVITELMARRVAHRVLIVTPAGPLLKQWETEMSQRFGLRLDIINRQRLEDIRRSTELGANPFDHIALGLASIDFLKQERVLDQLERASYDVVIVDEAHHCMDLGNVQERDDSQRRRLAEVLARRCDALLLLTATPHDGNDRSFASLCELLDPALVDGRGMLRHERYRSAVVRRLKHHILDPVTKQPRFRERVVQPHPVTVSVQRHAAFVALQQGLVELVAPELRRAFKARRYHDVLAFIALLKRSVSTAAACKSTLQAVTNRFQHVLAEQAEGQDSRRQRLKTLQEYRRKVEQFGALSATEEQEQSSLEIEDLAQRLADLQRDIRSGTRTQTRTATIVDTLETLIEQAEQAAEHDPKLEQLVAEIKAIRTREPGANVLVYTEYTDSQAAVVGALQQAKVGPLLTMSGENSDAEREQTTRRFRSERNLILVSTDAAAEGLNLHEQCHHLIHLELPFNPNRLEQRNGRIDRFGQTHDPVVRYLFLRGTFEERILLRLIAKYERQRARLTFVPDTLGLTTSSDVMSERLLAGLVEEEGRLFNTDSDTNFERFFRSDEHEEQVGTDQATLELLEEIDRSLKGFEQATKANSWLGDAGLHADAQSLSEAAHARQQGDQANAVDLAQFVQGAVRLDGGDVRSNMFGDVFELVLPPAWRYGLDDMSGYDSSTHTIHLTTDIEVMEDAAGQAVGYLGRAHPLVRRALDRVRHLALGSGIPGSQDPRVSVVEADVADPILLFTFVGRITSGAGRELERVLAVLVRQDGDVTFYERADQWLPLADPQRARKTTGVFEQSFARWYNQARIIAEQASSSGFQPIGIQFSEQLRKELEADLGRQEAWMRERTVEITGKEAETVVQSGLFEGTSLLGDTLTSPPSWRSITNPTERLAAFSADGTQPSRLRSEADGVLRIFRQRMADLDRRLDLQRPEIQPLGVLMVVPERP